jgi:hypothetical protein
LRLGITTTTGLCIYTIDPENIYWSVDLCTLAEYPIVIIITMANEVQALSGFLLELNKSRIYGITHYQIDA